MHTRSRARLLRHHNNYTFCNLIRALRSGSCDKKSRSEYQTLFLAPAGEGLGTRLERERDKFGLGTRLYTVPS